MTKVSNRVLRIIDEVYKLNHKELIELSEVINKELRLSEMAIKEGFETEEGGNR